MQFATNQISFVLVRLLQTFYLPACGPKHTFQLAQDSQPAGTTVPEEWTGLKGRGKEEKAFVSAGMILGYKVRRRTILGGENGLTRRSVLQGGLWMRLIEDSG